MIYPEALAEIVNVCPYCGWAWGRHRPEIRIIPTPRCLLAPPVAPPLREDQS